jgi:hypothetical protein
VHSRPLELRTIVLNRLHFALEKERRFRTEDATFKTFLLLSRSNPSEYSEPPGDEIAQLRSFLALAPMEILCLVLKGFEGVFSVLKTKAPEKDLYEGHEIFCSYIFTSGYKRVAVTNPSV